MFVLRLEIGSKLMLNAACIRITSTYIRKEFLEEFEEKYLTTRSLWCVEWKLSQ